MKKLLQLCALSSFLFFAWAGSAHAATLYFNAAVDNDWGTLGNWWTDAAFTSSAGSLPGPSDDVVISADVSSNSDDPASVHTLTAKDTARIGITVTVSNGAVFNDASRLQADFIEIDDIGGATYDVTVAPNGDVYASLSGVDIYKQTGGVGDFIALNQAGSRNWFGMGAAANGDVYAGVQNGDIYKQTGGVGDFVALSQTSRDWRSLAGAPNGDIYAADFTAGNIYKQTGGVGNFNTLNQTSRYWRGVSAGSNGDIYAVDGFGSGSGGDIYKQTGGVGDFVALGQTIRSWGDTAVTPNGDVYASVQGGDIYKQTDGVGDFVSLGQISRTWLGMAAAPNGNVYATVNFGGIYKQDNVNTKIIGDACFAVTATNNGTVTGSTSGCAASVPSLTTASSTEITSAAFLLQGSIDATGGESSSVRGFQYGTTMSYGTTISDSGTFNAGSFSVLASGFACHTTYHYRAFATNSAGTSYGSDATFTTDSCSAASVLYGIDGSGSNPDEPNLYIIDPATGSTTETIGAVGFYVTGMAFDPVSGTLYGSTGGSDPVHPKSLITISTSTGAGTWLGTFKNGSDTTVGPMADIAFTSDGTLYGWSGSGSDLYLLDPASCNGSGDTKCLATKVGEAGVGGTGNGLAFDSDDRLFLLGNADEGYFEIDPDTGLSLGETDFANPSGNFLALAAATFTESGFLFAPRLDFGDPDADLVFIDLNTATIFSAGPNADMTYMDAIAFYIPPVAPDTTAPDITILGSNPAEVLQKNTYTDAGATADDDTDGDLTSEIVTTGSVDTQTLGTYEIVYQVTDAADNTAYATRTVEVISRSEDDDDDQTSTGGHHHGSGGGSSTSHQASSTDEQGDTARLEHLITILQQILSFLMGKGSIPTL